MKFYLEKPTLKRKEDVIDYLTEFAQDNSPINGSSLFENILYGQSYEQCLKNIEKLVDVEYAKSVNRLPVKVFFLIRKEDNKLIGMINIRSHFDEELDKFKGHIGYSIRPSERQKGYNKIQLYLGLEKAKELGLKRVRLSCEVDNLGSNKTIKALGGILEESAIDPSDNIATNVYWIDIQKSIHQYQRKYEKYTIQ